MPIKVDVNVEGVEGVTSQIDTMKDGLSQRIPDALREIGELIVSNAQARAPVDTGFLRDNIQVQEESDSSVTVVSAAEYSGFVENGTSKMAAQPFFQPAIEESKPEIERIIKEAISSAGR